ncbi:MAG: hypothetical protein ABEI97_03270, partial [Candidatus Nanohaloarchaea archaeon]
GVERETVSGSETKIPMEPSNVRVTKLNLDDERRLAKYEVSEAEKEEISVEPEEEEEPGEDVEEEAYDEEPDEKEAVEADGAAYDEVVGGTVDEVKQAVEDEGLDPAKVLDAEEANKDRVTLVEWLETRVEDGESDE